jgi:hypothetical protein
MSFREPNGAGMTLSQGWMPEKYFWRSGREKCFSLDIPSYRTSGLPTIREVFRVVTRELYGCFYE